MTFARAFTTQQKSKKTERVIQHGATQHKAGYDNHLARISWQID